MILNDLLSSDWFTPVNKKLAKDFWFIIAWYFWELIRQRKRFWQEEFYFSQNDMKEEIWISAFEQRDAVKKLSEKWFIIVQKKWLPAKYYFKINDELVLKYFNNQWFKKWSTSDLKNEAHNNKEIIINNNNKIIKEKFFKNEELNNKLNECIIYRKQIKKPITQYWIELLINKINKWSNEYNTSDIIEFINNSIINN
jgi:hypothetical protein